MKSAGTMSVIVLMFFSFLQNPDTYIYDFDNMSDTINTVQNGSIIFLNLTDEQKAKAKEIREQSRKDIEPLMKEMETIREKMDKVREADMKKFEDLLTPEQKAKLDELKKHREDMHENGDRPGFRPHKFEDFPKPGMIKD